jgi:methyltransferase (TIGR00027 family)
MLPYRPSATARRVALSRAAHQMWDSPLVLQDPVALRLVDPQARAGLERGGLQRHSRLSRSIRAYLVARSRFAEDQLAASLARGVRQYVVLGAGMDSFAYRNPHIAAGLRVWEVDHPATQAYKREQLTAAGIEVPDSVTHVPIDFHRQSLAEQLQHHGFDTTVPSFFSWLGVSMYLEPTTVLDTLRWVATALPEGSGLAMDYVPPIAQQPWAVRAVLRVMALAVAAHGEPWRGFFDPAELAQALSGMGYGALIDWDRDAINAHYFVGRHDGLQMGGGAHLLCAIQ